MNAKYNLAYFRKSRLVKIISALLLQTFIFYNIGFATIERSITSPNQKTPIRKILTKDNFLAPYVISRLVPLGEKELKDLDRRIRRLGRRPAQTEMSDRILRVKRNWIKKYLGSWIEKAETFARERGIKFNQHILLNAFITTFDERATEVSLSTAYRENIDTLAQEEIAKMRPEASPGHGSLRSIAVETPLTQKQMEALHGIYRSLIDKNALIATNGIAEGMTRQIYLDLETAIENHNIICMSEGRKDEIIPLDFYVHPGRGGEQLGHKGRITHLSRWLNDHLTEEEIRSIEEHERGHIEHPELAGEPLAEYERRFPDEMRRRLDDVDKERVRTELQTALSKVQITAIVPILEARLIELIMFNNTRYLSDALDVLVESERTRDCAAAAIKLLSKNYPIWSNDWFDRALEKCEHKNEVKRLLEEAGKREVNMDNVRIVILAGGGGTRVWPMSTTKNPKQLLSFTRSGRTMVQETIWRLVSHGYVQPGQIYVQTIPKLRDKIISQVDKYGIDGDHVLAEPELADSGAAVGYAAAKLYREDKNTTMVILSADHIIGQFDEEGRENFEEHEDFWRSIYELIRKVQGQPELGTISIYPTRPETGFGYLHRGRSTSNVPGISKLSESTEVNKKVRPGGFLEKPDIDVAESLINENRRAEKSGEDVVYGWNSGMFVWDAKTILDAFGVLQPAYHKGLMEIVGEDEERNPDDQRAVEEKVFKEFAKWRKQGLRTDGKIIVAKNKTSIDYLIMEPASAGRIPQLAVVGAFGWKYPWIDVGNLGSPLREVNMEREDKETENVVIGMGNGVLTADLKDVEKSNVVVEAGITVHARGLAGMTIVATKDSVLVVPIAQAQKVKDIVDELKDRGLGKYVDGAEKGSSVERTKREFTLDLHVGNSNRYIYMPNGDVAALECREAILLSNDGIVSGIGLEKVTVIKDKDEVYVFGGAYQKKAEAVLKTILTHAEAEEAKRKAELKHNRERRLKDIRDILMRKDILWVSPHRYATLYEIPQATASEELELLSSLEWDEHIDEKGRPVSNISGIVATYLPVRGGDYRGAHPADTAHKSYMRCEPKEDMFKTFDLRGVTLTTFPDKVCFYIGRAIAEKLLNEFGEEDDITVVVGKEVREGGAEMQEALIRGLLASGINVNTLEGNNSTGFLATPDLYFGIVSFPFFKAGIMLTAGHHPTSENGVRMNKRFGKGDEEDPEAVLDHSEGFFEITSGVWVQDLRDRLKTKGLNFRVRTRECMPVRGELNKYISPNDVVSGHFNHIMNDIRLSPEISTQIMEAWKRQPQGPGKTDLMTFVERVKAYGDNFEEKNGWDNFRAYVKQELGLDLPPQKP
ncbi:MAG: hypothetical protein A2Z72_07680, partial [Omnitrophica bacterium RBG_13_46_9]